jgi:hypothetical protein
MGIDPMRETTVKNHPIRAVCLSVALLIGVAAPIPAYAWGHKSTTSTTTTASTPAPLTQAQIGQMIASSPGLKWLEDSVAITKIKLSPFAHQLVNSLLTAATPLMCPLVAKLAVASFQDFVKSACLALGTSADPWSSLVQFVPLLCSTGDQIFPSLAALLPTVCGLLL